MTNEQISFSEIKRLSNIALESGDLNRLQDLLYPLLKEEDKTRSASDNLFIYRTIGRVHREQKKTDEARTAYLQAHSYDPRDFETLNALVEEELTKAPQEVDSNLLMELLIFHRPSLKPNMVMRIFQKIGDAHAASDDLVKARENYEKALDACPGEKDLIDSLMKVSEASGDDKAMAKARERLLASMTSAESRAAFLVSIGDDYHNRKNDEDKALSLYEEALSEYPLCSDAHKRILVISEHKEDWDRCLNALNALIQGTKDEEEKCKNLLKMAWIFKEKINNYRRTIEVFNQVLDIQPNQLDVFQGMIAMQQSQDDYVGIEKSYLSMIARHKDLEPQNTKLLAALYKNLGELRVKQFSNISGAAEAYQEVSNLYPDNVNFHIILAKLYETDDSTLEKAIYENRQILRLAPDKTHSVNDMAKCYRKLGKFDEALCIYRVLNVLQTNDDEGKAIVEKFASNEVPKITEKFTNDIWELIFPESLDRTLVNIFKICAPIIGDRFSNDFATYGIHEKEARIDINENTPFNNTIRNEITALGFGECPLLYRCDKFKGVTNAYFSNRSFLVHSNCLKGRSNKELAFLTAKALLLMRPEYYLLQLGMKNIELILFAIFKTMIPDLKINLDKNQESISKTLAKGLSGEQRSSLSALVDEIFNKRSSKLNTRMFMASVDDFGNRVGLLFCDDPSVIERLLAEESKPLSTRSVRDRNGSLMLWALSEEYLTLRKKLNIALKA